MPSRELVRSLREGDVFIGTDYPLGTIVRFEEEYLSLGYKAKTAHSRMPENDDWTVSESFRRVNSVYIWVIGNGARNL